MESVVWSRPGASAAACSVFALAGENPILRPSSSDVIERWAAALAPGATSVPRLAVEEVIAALPDTDVARLAGLSGQARLVGYALAALRDGTAVPWHRVINAQGKLSLERAGASSGTTQRLRLAREGVTVDAAGRVSLARFGWKLTTGRDRRQSTHREDSDSSHSADEKHRPRAKASRSKRRSDNALDA